MSIVIIDFGLSNISSVYNTIIKIHKDIIVSSDKNVISKAKLLILPGIGTYKDAMTNLVRLDLVDTIIDCVKQKNIPIIGICLGMQLFSTYGDECGRTKGLNLIEGEVKKIVLENKEYRIPHVGWNEITHNNSSIFTGIPNNTDYYFVHSYSFVPKNENEVLAHTEYGTKIAAAIGKDNIYGFQFHPEKSQKAGLILLKNIITKYMR